MFHILYATTSLLLQTNPRYATSFALNSQMYPWYHRLQVMGCAEFAKMLVGFWSCAESVLANRYELGPSRTVVSLDRRNTGHQKKDGEVVSPEWPNSVDVLIACPTENETFWELTTPSEITAWWTRRALMLHGHEAIILSWYQLLDPKTRSQMWGLRVSKLSVTGELHLPQRNDPSSSQNSHMRLSFSGMSKQRGAPSGFNPGCYYKAIVSTLHKVTHCRRSRASYWRAFRSHIHLCTFWSGANFTSVLKPQINFYSSQIHVSPRGVCWGNLMFPCTIWFRCQSMSPSSLCLPISPPTGAKLTRSKFFQKAAWGQ